MVKNKIAKKSTTSITKKKESKAILSDSSSKSQRLKKVEIKKEEKKKTKTSVVVSSTQKSNENDKKRSAKKEDKDQTSKDKEVSTKIVSDSNGTKSNETNMVKLIEKGGAAVDHEVPNAQNYYVLPDPDNQFNGKHFCATLNMSDLKNNNNKFYLIQILVDSKTNQYIFWNRWGRVGYSGQNSDGKCPNKDTAIKSFLKKYNEKTSKGYEHIEIDYANEEGDGKKEKNEKNEKGKNEKKNTIKEDDKNKIKKDLLFDHTVKDLLNLIYDIQLMNQQMKEIGYDANKMPLGKLSQHMIKDGYEVLREIEQVLKGTKKSDLYELSSRFYTIIPHNFGYQ